MTRQEHIEWCKKRAIEEMDYYNDPIKGIISMMSDLKKHSETNCEALIVLCGAMLIAGKVKTRQQAIDFINGFN